MSVLTSLSPVMTLGVGSELEQDPGEDDGPPGGIAEGHCAGEERKEEEGGGGEMSETEVFDGGAFKIVSWKLVVAREGGFFFSELQTSVREKARIWDKRGYGGGILKVQR